MMEAKDRLSVAVDQLEQSLTHRLPPATLSSLSGKETASGLPIPTIFHVCAIRYLDM